MSSRLSRVAAGVIALLIAGGAMACPGSKNESADRGQTPSAQQGSQTPSRG
jgi:hypothetical protein